MNYLITGVANFNSQNGCLKCTTTGEYSYLSHTNFFPRTDCNKRTDAEFRRKAYGSHHKIDSPLLRLPIDMIEDFVVGDSLHLVDLGLMKKCLLGWRDGHFGNYKSKLRASEILKISDWLKNRKMPRELHRAVRGLDCLAHWKGTEFRTFLLYLGIVVLKPFLAPDVYEHFLAFYCAIVMCSSDSFAQWLNVAEKLFSHFIEGFCNIYGEDYITSNVHNLSHIVDEVRRFGKLSNFNAYPFESKLYEIKNMIRSGHKPLTQFVKRIQEQEQLETHSNDLHTPRTPPAPTTPVLKNPISNKEIVSDVSSSFYKRIDFPEFSLSNDDANKWVLTKSNVIAAVKSISKQNDQICINVAPLSQIRPFFELPIKSTHLKIFKSDIKANVVTKIGVSDIQCKMVAVPLIDSTSVVFIPLFHTLK